jgi:hypothetical protein
MPEKKTIKRARQAKRAGKAPSTQAGEFVKEQIHKIRRGEHGARSTKQAIAIGLSQARRAGVKLPPPEEGEASERTRKGAERAYRSGQEHPRRKPSTKRSRAVTGALKREGKDAASQAALSKQAKGAARKRTAAERSASAKKAAETKGPARRRQAAQKAVRTKGHAGLARAARKAARTRAAS